MRSAAVRVFLVWLALMLAGVAVVRAGKVAVRIRATSASPIQASVAKPEDVAWKGSTSASSIITRIPCDEL